MKYNVYKHTKYRVYWRVEPDGSVSVNTYACYVWEPTCLTPGILAQDGFLRLIAKNAVFK
ncbi:hypothetical protein HOU72_gp39 [Pectobacterium phage Khlen]|uniref:Uncharacterized protein n=1 Tax=Pectobacterium phage Khlen TaxID=2489627 RepID=A0A3G8FL22_9CAUD|nr:hypothetical protein HOU72_gp39 [Pectobacterium phage Khlen]AZF94570.1 hypothetical protein [Pectobacterium phage Khlen]